MLMWRGNQGKLVAEWLQDAILGLTKYQPEQPSTLQAKGEVSSATLETFVTASAKRGQASLLPHG